MLEFALLPARLIRYRGPCLLAPGQNPEPICGNFDDLGVANIQKSIQSDGAMRLDCSQLQPARFDSRFIRIFDSVSV